MHTGTYAAALHALMCSQKLIAPQTRLWLRLNPCGLVARKYPSVRALQHAVTMHGAHDAAVSGIVSSLTTSIQRVYSRTLMCVQSNTAACSLALMTHTHAIECSSTNWLLLLLHRCTACSFEFQHIEGAKFAVCNCGQGLWEERVQGRVLCPSRVAYICDASSISGTFKDAASLKITLTDDLTRHDALRVG